MKAAIYTSNKPLINSIGLGLLYLVFCWSLDWGDATKLLFITLMPFLPGVTFPLTTCYYHRQVDVPIESKTVVHFILSIGMYHGSVWLFSGEGRIKYITILAGFLGSFLFLSATKYLLKKHITLSQIFLASVLSGLSFLPYEIIGRLGILMGIAVFFWTITNGFLLNQVYREGIKSA